MVMVYKVAEAFASDDFFLIQRPRHRQEARVPASTLERTLATPSYNLNSTVSSYEGGELTTVTTMRHLTAPQMAPELASCDACLPARLPACSCTSAYLLQAGFLDLTAGKLYTWDQIVLIFNISFQSDLSENSVPKD